MVWAAAQDPASRQRQDGLHNVLVAQRGSVGAADLRACTVLGELRHQPDAPKTVAAVLNLPAALKLVAQRGGIGAADLLK